MKAAASLAPALILALSALPVRAEEIPESPAAHAAGCDSSRNRETWYFEHRDCGPASTQVSFLANVSREKVAGSQAAFAANVAARSVENAQVAFLFNYADSIHGSQWSWDMNLARKVDGFQVSGLNVADTVNGSQIGFLNISRRLEGYGIGFFTFAGNSMLHGDVRVDETGMTKLGFTTGKGFFTSYTLGYTVAEDSHPYGFGMGFGYHAPFRRSYLEGELGIATIMDEATDFHDLEDHRVDFDDDDFRYNTHLQAKLRLGGRLFRGVSVFAAVTGNALITHGEDRLIGPWTDDFTGTIDDTSFWPGLELGIRLGR